MSENVQPEEVEAIMDLQGTRTAKAAQVVQRDFRRPRRLSPVRVDEMLRVLRAPLAEAQAHWGELLGPDYELGLASISECDTDTWKETLEDPLALVSFLVDGQPGWTAWSSLSATGAVERLLGSSSDTPQRRALSEIERRVLEGLLIAVAQPILKAFGKSPERVAVIGERQNIEDWRDGGDAADPHRLVLEISVDGPGDPEGLFVLLPGVRGDDAGSGHDRLESIPTHLDPVEVVIHACLEGSDVTLEQLLALEEGDVIPIEARVGDTLTALVEGQTFAHAHLGQRQGRLAMRITDFETSSGTER